MRRGNEETPFGRGPRLRTFFDGFFDDPFFEDPFFQQRSSFFSSPFSSTFFSPPFGGLVDEILLHRHPAMQSMQGMSAGTYGSGPSHQVSFSFNYISSPFVSVQAQHCVFSLQAVRVLFVIECTGLGVRLRKRDLHISKGSAPLYLFEAWG